jgi:SAM-dependent methyltransferase
MEKEKVREAVRDTYGQIARADNADCGCGCGCGPGATATPESLSVSLGYSSEDVGSVPEGVNLGLGCGNPIALASLKEGETVLDLGSGAGFDCFLAAERVGQTGRVIGVDMTPDMLQRARENASKGSYDNVEFRLGEIENLPVADGSVDVIISNCVINLSPDKDAVFKEAFRVLKPGGRLMVSDVVLLKELPQAIMDSVEAYVGCVSGASMKGDYLDIVRATGFDEVRIVGQTSLSLDLLANDPTARSIIDSAKASGVTLEELQDPIASIQVSARKPL